MIVDLQARLDALRQVRGSGYREVEYDGQRVRFGTDAELAAAIADLERQIAAGNPAGRVQSVVFSTTKGI